MIKILRRLIHSPLGILAIILRNQHMRSYIAKYLDYIKFNILIYHELNCEIT